MTQKYAIIVQSTKAFFKIIDYTHGLLRAFFDCWLYGIKKYMYMENLRAGQIMIAMRLEKQ